VPLSLYKFGEYELDQARFELRRNGHPLKLERIPMELLFLLAQKDGNLVTRQEIVERLWGKDVHVDTEHGINTAVRKVRAVLGEDAERPRYVQTVSGKGYRFVAARKPNGNAPTLGVNSPAPSPTVADVPSAAEPLQSKRMKWRTARLAAVALCLLAGAVLALNVAGLRDRVFTRSQIGPIHSIAVLPLSNLSGDASQEYFADGMTDELITEIAKFTQLRVISHASVERYKETQKPLAEIARELGVDAVVEGSVTRSGNRVRIATRLIDARSERNLWAESYEHDIQDVLAAQQEVAAQVTSRLGVELPSPERGTSRNSRVVDVEAHEDYLRGLFYWNQINCDAFRKSLAYFQQSAARDAAFPPVWAGLAQSYSTLADFDCVNKSEVIPQAKSAALKAIELDPRLGAPHCWLARVAFSYEWDWPKAEKEFQTAIALDPNDAIAHVAYARFLVAQERREQGLVEVRKALELDPTSLTSGVSATYFYYLAREFDQAIEQGKKTVELYPNSPAAYMWLAFSYERKGEEAEAIAAHLKSEATWGATSDDLAQLRAGYAKAGMRGYWLYQLAAERRRGGDTNVDKACWMAEIHAHLGENKLALDYLKRALQHPCNEIPLLGVDPLYDGLRDDAGFKELLAQLHLRSRRE
jgi:TolB-like protein/DNA-binding winged helix-turn-helix (wHTH) protein